jgi:hypothetical protein
MTWLIAALVFVALGAFLWQYGKRPVTYRHVTPDGFRPYVSSLLRQATPGSILLANREQGDGFLQFALVKADRTWAELEFGLPQLEWAGEGFERLERDLPVEGFQVRIQKSEAPFRFMRVRVSGSPAVTCEAALRLITQSIVALKWSEARFRVQIQGGLRNDAAGA